MGTDASRALPKDSSTRSRYPLPLPLVLTLLVLSALAIFTLPFHVPVQPAASDSYFVGFSNHAALLLTLLFFGLVALFSSTGALPSPAALEQPSANCPSPFLLCLALSVSGALCIGLSLAIRRAHGFLESAYFLDRLGLMAQGFHLYRDIEFIYGPWQLALPFALMRLLHLQPVDAYAIVWTLSTLLGIALLWQALRWLPTPSPRASSILFCLATALLLALSLSNGLNYNPLRYTAPIALLLGLDRLDRHLDRRLRNPGDNSPRHLAFLLLPLAVLLADTALLGWSPEEGLALATALLLFLPARHVALTRRLHPARTLALLVATALPIALMAHLGVFRSMQSFSNGSFLLPVLPGPHILLLLLTLGALVHWASARPAHLRSAPALLALYALGMLPGALGRCDLPHVLGYELGAILCGTLLLWRSSPGRWLCLALCAPLTILGPTSLQELARGLLKINLDRTLAPSYTPTSAEARLNTLAQHQMLLTLGPLRAHRKLDRIRAVAAMPSLLPHDLFPHATLVVYAPFGYAPSRLGPVQDPTLREGRFFGTLNVYTAPQLEQKISEMRRHSEQDLLLPANDEPLCPLLTSNPGALRPLLLTPFVPRPKHTFDLLSPLCTFITHNYRQITPATSATADYSLWRFQSTP